MTCIRCPICGEKPIKSHIIPQGFLRDVDNKIYPREMGHPKRSPIGIYEKILCAKCDNWLGITDNYALQVLNAGGLEKSPDFKVNIGKPGIKYLEYNYHKLCKFFLSVLWRAQYCSHQFYKKVQNVDVKNKLDELFCCGNVSVVNEFHISLHYNIDLHTNGLTLQPVYLKSEDRFEFLINNMIVTIDLTLDTILVKSPFKLSASGSSLIVPLQFWESKWEMVLREMVMNND